MTNKSNKENHREIQKKNASPDSEQSKKDMEEIVYGDENNPNDKLNVGDDIADYLGK